MRSFGCLWVFVGSFAFLCIIMGFMGPYRCFWVPMDSNVSLLVIMGPYSSLCFHIVFIGPYSF